MADADPQYWAFISYSHADADVAAKLHRALEAYRLPRVLQRTACPIGKVPDRLFPVFRDQEEMSAGQSLPEVLTRALDASRTLIVLCSPAARESKWVDKEIRYFIRKHGPERVFPVLVDGDPDPRSGAQYAFPTAVLAGDAPRSVSLWSISDPLAVELRPGLGDTRHAVMQLVAAIVGVRLAALTQRALEEERGRRRLSWAVSAGLAVLLVAAGLGWYNAWKAEQLAVAAQAAQWVAEQGRKESEAARAALESTNGLQIHERRTVYDMRGWQAATPEQLARGERVSFSESRNELQVQRTSEAQQSFVHTVNSTSPFGIEIFGTLADMVEKTPREGERVWELTWDISDLPLGEIRTVSWSVRFWNADQTPEQLWAGFRIKQPTRHASFTILFPASRVPDPASIRYTVTDHSGKTDVVRDYTASDGDAPQLAVDPEGAVRLEWHVASPLMESSYRAHWGWKP